MSYTSLNYHIVFSTKSRKQYLNDEQVQGAAKYIGGILGNQKGCLLLGNGMPDHIHLLCSLHPDSSISEIVRTIKANSSRWIHENYHNLKTFEWQEGYSAFSVSYSGTDKVLAYIRNQQEHHRKMTFEEELLSLLKKHKIQFKPEYVFG
jgi:REP element-mobilizing transposase RayT